MSNEKGDTVKINFHPEITMKEIKMILEQQGTYPEFNPDAMEEQFRKDADKASRKVADMMKLHNSFTKELQDVWAKEIIKNTNEDSYLARLVKEQYPMPKLTRMQIFRNRMAMYISRIKDAYAVLKGDYPND